MYPGYEQYWLSLLANSSIGTENEKAYARRADKIPHIVLSKTLDKVKWKTTTIVRGVEEIRKMKQQPGQGYARPRWRYSDIQSYESRIDR